MRIGAEAIPNVALQTAGDTTTLFLARGIATLREAARYLWALPYGRVSNALRPDLVLHEGRGTCTTKHALLASLAAEQEIDLALTLGVYEMTERNTPGVGPVLDRYGLEAIPEAHCYVVWQGKRIDITRQVNAPEAITRFLYEERIGPKNIAPYKMRIHRQCLNKWRERGGTSAVKYSLEELWRIREECIAALERASTTSAECRTFVKGWATMDAKENAERMLEVFRAIERRDAQRVFGLCHEDVEFHWPPSLPYGGVAQGFGGDRPRWTETWMPLQPTPAEQQMEPRIVAATDREVVVVWRQRGLSPNGERLDTPVLGLYQVRDGKLARAQMFYFDPVAVADFLVRAI